MSALAEMWHESQQELRSVRVALFRGLFREDTLRRELKLRDNQLASTWEGLVEAEAWLDWAGERIQAYREIAEQAASDAVDRRLRLKATNEEIERLKEDLARLKGESDV